MSDGHRLAQLMRQAGKTPQNEIVDIIVGEVTSAKPLKVKVENRELTESFLILGPFCKEYRIKANSFTVPTHTHTVDGSTSSPANSVPTDVLLWRGIKVGDKVLMLKVSRGQKYYLLQRVEGVTV